MVEVLIVISILGILGTMGTSYVLAARPHMELERAEMQLMAQLNAARHLAISEEVQVRVQFDTASTPNYYWVESFDSDTASWVAAALPVADLPDIVTLTDNTFAGETVQFNTRGALVSGGALTLAAGDESSTISGNLANGRFQYGGGNTR